jgi:thioredoxin reductase
MAHNTSFDVIIIGGSYAGLSAAMALGRSLRNVLIIDSGLPCNRQTPHSHNFITQDGETPGAIAQKAREQVLSYPTVQFLNGEAVNGKQTDKGFVIITAAGDSFTAKKLIFATGIKDIMPAIPGFSECWGISVIHCPYCHGYEVRGRKTGIMANGNKALHLASLVHNLTDKITLLTIGKAAFAEEEFTRLQAHNIQVIEKPVASIEQVNGQVQQVIFSDGSSIAFDAVYAAVPFVQHSDIPVALGCILTDQGYLKTDASQKTSVAGVFACGDNTGMMRSVASAVASGNMAGVMVNLELTKEAF